MDRSGPCVPGPGENEDRFIFSLLARGWSTRAAPLNAAADDLFHFIQETLVAGELASLQGLTHQRKLLLRYALLHKAWNSVHADRIR